MKTSFVRLNDMIYVFLGVVQQEVKENCQKKKTFQHINIRLKKKEKFLMSV